MSNNLLASDIARPWYLQYIYWSSILWQISACQRFTIELFLKKKILEKLHKKAVYLRLSFITSNTQTTSAFHKLSISFSQNRWLTHNSNADAICSTNFFFAGEKKNACKKFSSAIFFPRRKKKIIEQVARATVPKF